jgi:Zinc-binding dehydrogenase
MAQMKAAVIYKNGGPEALRYQDVADRNAPTAAWSLTPRRSASRGAIQLAKRADATVITTASSDEKLKRLKALGLDHGINYATESFVERTNQLTNTPRAARRSAASSSRPSDGGLGGTANDSHVHLQCVGGLGHRAFSPTQK